MLSNGERSQVSAIPVCWKFAFLVAAGSGFCKPPALPGPLESHFKSDRCHGPVDEFHVFSGAAGPGASLGPAVWYFSLLPQGRPRGILNIPAFCLHALQPCLLLHLSLNSSLFSPPNNGQLVSSGSQTDRVVYFSVGG